MNKAAAAKPTLIPKAGSAGIGENQAVSQKANKQTITHFCHQTKLNKALIIFSRQEKRFRLTTNRFQYRLYIDI